MSRPIHCIGSPEFLVLLLKLRDALFVSRRDTADEAIINVGLANPDLDALNAIAELIRHALNRSSRGAELISERPHHADGLCFFLR